MNDCSKCICFWEERYSEDCEYGCFIRTNDEMDNCYYSEKKIKKLKQQHDNMENKYYSEMGEYYKNLEN